MTRRMLVLAATVCVALPAATAAAAGTLDQSQPDAHGAFSSINATRWSAQTFTAGIDGQLDQVDLPLSHSGDPGDLTVEVRTVEGGEPSSTVLATETVSEAAVPTGTFDWVSVALSAPAPSSAGTQYAIVLSAPGGSEHDHQYQWAASIQPGGPYPGGQGSRTLDGGATWDGLGADHGFKTYVVEETLTPSSKDECKHGGWQRFDRPAFKNQGDCVSFVASNRQ